MKTLRNQVQLIGNLGQDIEVKEFESGSKVAKFTLATHDYYKDKNGEKQEDTQWHNIVAWGKLADWMSDSLGKGDEVLVQGRLTYRKYEDKSGNVNYITEVIVNEFLKMN